ncbi:Poly(A) polymerase central domain-containing protein [Gorgonomyces haynaldii]|nr:Poly(A) polymerase central domain-containing protein [Gorgonomyces haynaldii]
MTKNYGVTPPISTNFPVEAETKATSKLVETLKEYGQYETEEEQRSREIVLTKLDMIFKEFVRNYSIKNGLPESLADEVGGKIYTFGSYRLGVHGKSSDIDTLCVAPKHVKREDFFTHMYEILKAREEVTEITAVADAYVPVIKMDFSGISIDLVFAQMGLSTVPESLDLSDDNLLKNLDERCVRSLNGSRVTDAILKLVPNVESFRIALRCIKLWAKQKAIYSNVLGFFGGVAWAIVTARVCQLYPNAAAGAIVSKFFRIMHQWEWPVPVLLKAIEEGPLSVRVWNPKIYPQDKAHRMPVITPAYPCMCSTHNVCASTQAVTTDEFLQAAEIADKILLGQEVWAALFKKHEFFHKYKYYLQVVASSKDQEEHLKWSGMVESRLRQLVSRLEVVEQIERAHPFIKGFDRNAVCRTEEEKLQFGYGDIQTTDPSQPPSGSLLEEPVTMYSTTFYIGIGTVPKDPNNPNAPRQLDISWPSNEFIKMVKQWDKYDVSKMAIHIKCIKKSTISS